MDNYFAREAEIMDIVFDLDKDQFRILTFAFDRNICQIIIESAVVEWLTRDRGAAGSRHTGCTALWSLSKTHLS